MATTHREATGIDVEPLRAALRGELHAPSDEGYDAARTPWNLAVDQRPVAVVAAEDADDVVAAVRFAVANGLGVRGQGTGHGAVGPLDGALLVDTSRMTQVRVDPEARIGRAEAGARWDHVRGLAGAHGLAALSGSTPHVSVTGYSLGGGMGWLGRRWGLASNSVTAVELVTPDGILRRVDADHDPELFWALRGGGGSFGVVTAIEFRLHPVPEAYAGQLFWPIERAPEVLPAAVAWTRTLPETVTTSLKLMRMPPIELVPEPLRGRAFMVVLVAAIAGEEEGAELVAPMRGLEPEIDMVGAIPPQALADIAGDPEDPLPTVFDHFLLEEMTPEAIEAVLERVGPGVDSTILVAEFRQLGGAFGRVAPGSGALAALDGEFAYLGMAIPMTPEMGAAIGAELAGLRAALEPWRAERRYLNFTDGETHSSDFFADDVHARLSAVRRRVDPDGVMRANHPIDASR